MKNKLLTVSIPSNNKTNYLIESINLFLDIKQNDEFEICISDNANISRLKILRESINDFDNKVKYFHNPKFAKMSQNFDNAINIATGEYVWLFGDDDLPSKNSIKIIKNALNNYDVDLIITNSSSFYDNNIIIEPKRVNCSVDKFYHKKSNNDFMSELASYISFVSALIVKKQSWVKSKISSEDEYFLHVQKILNIKKNSNCLFLCSPLVKMRVFSQTWTNNYFKIWMISWPKVIWEQTNYDTFAKYKVIPKKPTKFFFKVLSKKAYGYYSFNDFKNYILNDEEIVKIKKIIFFIISLLPKFIFKWTYLAIIKLNIKKNNNNFSSKLSLIQLNKS